MYRHHIDPLLPRELDERNVSPELVYLVFEVAEDVVCAQGGQDLGYEAAGDREALVVRDDVEGDVELVKAGLNISQIFQRGGEGVTCRWRRLRSMKSIRREARSCIL